MDIQQKNNTDILAGVLKEAFKEGKTCEQIAHDLSLGEMTLRLGYYPVKQVELLRLIRQLLLEGMSVKEKLSNLVAEGLLFSDCVDVFGIHRDNNFWASMADKKYGEEGSIEIDDKTVVSDSEDGNYVMAWLWVPNSEGPLIIKTEDGYTFHRQNDGTYTDHKDAAKADLVYDTWEDLLAITEGAMKVIE